MKPRLRMKLSGDVQLVRPGINQWTETEAKRWIREHYGSLKAFAERFNFPYSAVIAALNHYTAVKTAGPVSIVRQFIGLKTQPTKLSLNLSIAQRSRRGQPGYYVHPGAPS